MRCAKCKKPTITHSRLCLDCGDFALSRREDCMEKADNKALADLSRRLLSDIKAAKGEATTPQILHSALEELGGVEGVGKLVARGYKRASGDLTPQELAKGMKANANLEHKYADLITRISIKNDERESTDISNLSDEDLRNTLIALARELVVEHAEFRRLVVMEGIRSQPDLIHEAMNVAGMPVADQPTQGHLTDEDPEDDFFESEATDEEGD